MLKWSIRLTTCSWLVKKIMFFLLFFFTSSTFYNHVRYYGIQYCCDVTLYCNCFSQHGDTTSSYLWGQISPTLNWNQTFVITGGNGLRQVIEKLSSQKENYFSVTYFRHCADLCANTSHKRFMLYWSVYFLMLLSDKRIRIACNAFGMGYKFLDRR